jgi:hypothetical protein
MKKLVTIANIIFWAAFLILMAALFSRGILFKFLAPDAVAFIIWAAGFLMFVGFQMLFIASVPAPKIKKGRYYKLEKIVPHSNGSLFIILSYDDNVEIYKGEEIFANSTQAQIGNKYLVEIENGTVFFTT